MTTEQGNEDVKYHDLIEGIDEILSPSNKDEKTYIKIVKLKLNEQLFSKNGFKKTIERLRYLSENEGKNQKSFSNPSNASQRGTGVNHLNKQSDTQLKEKWGKLLDEAPSANCPVCFDRKNGNIFYNNQRIGTIGLNNRERYFFECLYIRYGEAVYHSDIKKYIDKHAKYIDSRLSYDVGISHFCSDIKRRLPKAVERLIQSGKGYYTMSDNMP